MADLEKDLADTLMEGISAPDVPRAPGLQAHEAVGELMTSAGYLEMVRLKIESRKRYPEAAKLSRIDGR